MIVQVCVGSSCHLKGSEEIVELLNNAVAENGLEDEVVLVGSFCVGRCNRIGVTVQVDDDTYTGVTKENFKEFFSEKILSKTIREGG
ncbi:MAG: (2Fe-2S) ferredoxin domain-containing protein [Clostridia bacterium]|nr:(2Fe-2S) ferredoxin domain-containing protein [Clostridia bacterium]